MPPGQAVHVALATALASIIFTGLSSARALHRRGSVLWPSVAWLVPGVLLGGWLGSLLRDRAWMAMCCAGSSPATATWRPCRWPWTGRAPAPNAPTRRAAVELASQEKPDLILADIQLADNSSGIDAVNDILAQFDDIPVIFVTAFPERLLTGKRPEPAFLITKPYVEDQVRSAVSQAMFFASTETLAA